MLPTIIRLAAAVEGATDSTATFDLATNPYKAKRTWPPDFDKLDHRYQFRLEKRYRRRAKLKYVRPTWTKVTKLAQWASVAGVLVYGVLFMDMGSRESPFDGVRAWYTRTTAAMWTNRNIDADAESASPQHKGP